MIRPPIVNRVKFQSLCIAVSLFSIPVVMIIVITIVVDLIIAVASIVIAITTAATDTALLIILAPSLSTFSFLSLIY